MKNINLGGYSVSTKRLQRRKGYQHWMRGSGEGMWKETDHGIFLCLLQQGHWLYAVLFPSWLQMPADLSLCDPLQIVLMAANIPPLLLFGRCTLSPPLSVMSGCMTPSFYFTSVLFHLLSQQHQHQKVQGTGQFSKLISSISVQRSVMLGDTGCLLS